MSKIIIKPTLIPEGYEIDKENSTFERIVLVKIKKEVKCWSDIDTISGFFADNDSMILHRLNCNASDANKNIAPTKQDVESQLALFQLLHVRLHYVGKWVVDWCDRSQHKYCVDRTENNFQVLFYTNCYTELSFPTEEMANEFMENNLELIKTYFKIKSNGIW